MAWQVSLLFFYAFAAAGTVWERTYAHKTKLRREIPTAIAFGVGVLPVCVIAALVQGTIWVHWSWHVAGLLLAGGGLIGVSFVLGFMALRYLFASRYEIINQLSTVVSIIAGGVLLGEVLVGAQYGAAALLLVAALVATQTSVALPGTRLKYSHRGLLLAVVASTCLGFGMVAEKALLGHMSLSAYWIFGFGVQVAVTLLCASPGLRQTKRIALGEVWRAGLYGVLIAAAGIFYVQALWHADNLSLVATAAALQMPISVAVCAFVLRERRHMGRVVAAVVLGVGGLLLLQT